MAIPASLIARAEIDHDTSQEAQLDFESSHAEIDLKRIRPQSWVRFCVPGHKKTKAAEYFLGFKWNDLANLWLFVKGQEVLAYAEYPGSRSALVCQPDPSGRANSSRGET